MSAIDKEKAIRDEGYFRGQMVEKVGNICDDVAELKKHCVAQCAVNEKRFLALEKKTWGMITTKDVIMVLGLILVGAKDFLFKKIF